MLGKPGFFLRRWQDSALAWFDEWFASAACVWQTLLVCVAIVVVEIVWPSVDPHYFFLLFILTVYSAITQPALAQSNALASDKLEEVLTELQTIISRQAAIIASLQEEMAETNEILEDVHVLRQLEDDR